MFFRPTRAEPYNDTIYFKMMDGPNSGGFHVPVWAQISTLQASAPDGLDMGLVPINVEAKRTITIVNRGEVRERERERERENVPGEEFDPGPPHEV